MFYELSQNTDTTKIVKDTVKAAVQKSQELGSSVTFDISNITGDSLILSALGYTIVFLSLLFLFITFTYLTKLINLKIKKTLIAAGKYDEEKEDVEISGETAAAIAAALSLHFREIHDFENTVITIKKVQKRYSPWSSKIYGLREYPRK